MVIKLNLERENKIKELRKQGLEIGSEAEKQAFDMITQTQSHVLAAYDKAEADRQARRESEKTEQDQSNTSNKPKTEEPSSTV